MRLFKELNLMDIWINGMHKLLNNRIHFDKLNVILTVFMEPHYIL